jgi:hypothetical protein
MRPAFPWCRRDGPRWACRASAPPSAPGDNQEQVYGVAALTGVTGQLTTRRLAQPARSQAKTGQSQQQRVHVAFAEHLRDSARAYPARQYPAVVLTMDHAPWPRGALMAPV